MENWSPEAMSNSQEYICRKHEAPVVESPGHLKVGIADNVRSALAPVNGLRRDPEGDTTGWYIWAGEDLPEAADFFKPLHVSHLEGWCHQIIRFLGLPPGWRFLVAPNHEDVWFDPSLLNPK